MQAERAKKITSELFDVLTSERNNIPDDITGSISLYFQSGGIGAIDANIKNLKRKKKTLQTEVVYNTRNCKITTS